MQLIKTVFTTNKLELRLTRDLVRTIKRGHPWVFADALRRRPAAPPGTPALLLDNKKGRPIALGFYDAHSPLALRICSTTPETVLDDHWANQQLNRALALRQRLFPPETGTTGYRLFNGEGDGLPGLICDIYGNTAVLQLDGDGPAGFWHAPGIAQWLAKRLPVTCVYLKEQARSNSTGQALIGALPRESVPFMENHIHFTADVVNGQKTGFFLDQRENRRFIKQVARGCNTLNLFGYTGGFSVYAGMGQAGPVTTVDLAEPALQTATDHWQQNRLPAHLHHTVKADAFDFLETAAKKKQEWDLIIVDPPSFASSRSAVKKAVGAYKRLIAAAATVTGVDGWLAAASCSSHIDLPQFLSICEDSVSKARRTATVITINQQPADHPTPLPFSEFRYLKFVLLRVS